MLNRVIWWWESFIYDCKDKLHARVERVAAHYLAHRDWTVINLPPRTIKYNEFERYKFYGFINYSNWIESTMIMNLAETETRKRRGKAADRVNEKYLGDDYVD
jgi:hypothetical protein